MASRNNLVIRDLGAKIKFEDGQAVEARPIRFVDSVAHSLSQNGRSMPIRRAVLVSGKYGANEIGQLTKAIPVYKVGPNVTAVTNSAGQLVEVWPIQLYVYDQVSNVNSPAGSVLLTDTDGSFLSDADGAYMLEVA